MNDTFALFSLLSHPGVSPPIARQLIQLLGSAEAVLQERDKTTKPPDGVRDSLWKKLKATNVRKKSEKAWAKIEKEKVPFVDYRQDDFPLLLNHTHDGPLLLFFRGKPFPRTDKIVSIVGTQKPTKDALVFTKTIVESIKHVNPIIIISGLAEGIDVGSHQAALDAGLQTYACLAHGVNQCYPAFHSKIKAKIEEQGGCLTEHPIDSVLHPGYFLRRNRIIAGLSHATIVVSSRTKGGAMVTGRLAFDYNRAVFAVPGSPNYPTHLGCNHLIKKNIAQLHDKPSDFLTAMGWETQAASTQNSQSKLFQQLSHQQKSFLKHLDPTPKHLDLIALKAECPVGARQRLYFLSSC
jgi:DNA processing protein